MTRTRWMLWAALAAAAAGALAVHMQFSRDLASAAARAAQGSTTVATRCGPIEVQQAGEGLPLLMIHGSGGGHVVSFHFTGQTQTVSVPGRRTDATTYGTIR